MKREYGSNSRTIYENMCNSFGWDRTQMDCFAWGKSLCAVRADKERLRDVWFIYNPNYNLNLNDVSKNENKPIDTIIDNGEAIKETIPFSYETSHTQERIVFVKNANNKYEFLGIFSCDENARVRTWHRIATVYPIE